MTHAGSGARRTTGTGPHLVLYDGRCGLCHGLVRFVLVRDSRGLFHFASLQGPVAARFLEPLGVDPKGAETVYLVANYREPNPEIRVKARAILALFDGLGWPWRSAVVFRGLPARWLDGLYDLIARNRHRWFGRREACVVPSPEFRDRLLDPPEVEPAPGRREGS